MSYYYTRSEKAIITCGRNNNINNNNHQDSTNGGRICHLSVFVVKKNMELAVFVKMSQVPAGPDMGYKQVLESLIIRCSGWCVVRSLPKGHFWVVVLVVWGGVWGGGGSRAIFDPGS